MVVDKAVIVGLCGYEVIAVVSGKLPPITSICRQHRSVEAVLLLWLAVHLHRKIAEVSRA